MRNLLFLFFTFFLLATASSQTTISRCNMIPYFAKRFAEKETTVLGNVLALMNSGADETDIYLAMDSYLDQYEDNNFWIRKNRQGGHNGITAPDLISGFLTILYDLGKTDSFYDGRIFFGERLSAALRVAPAMHNNWQASSDMIFSDIPQLHKEIEKCK